MAFGGGLLHRLRLAALTVSSIDRSLDGTPRLALSPGACVDMVISLAEGCTPAQARSRCNKTIQSHGLVLRFPSQMLSIYTVVLTLQSLGAQLDAAAWHAVEPSVVQHLTNSGVAGTAAAEAAPAEARPDPGPGPDDEADNAGNPGNPYRQYIHFSWAWAQCPLHHPHATTNVPLESP